MRKIKKLKVDVLNCSDPGRIIFDVRGHDFSDFGAYEVVLDNEDGNELFYEQFPNSENWIEAEKDSLILVDLEMPWGSLTFLRIFKLLGAKSLDDIHDERKSDIIAVMLGPEDDREVHFLTESIAIQAIQKQTRYGDKEALTFLKHSQPHKKGNL